MATGTKPIAHGKKATKQITMVILVLLVVQFYLGMFENLLVGVPSNALPVNATVSEALTYSILNGGLVLTLHVVDAFLLMAVSFILMVLMLRNERWNKILSILGFVFILIAAINGIRFVMSNFSINGISYGMAGAFMGALVVYIILIYRIGKVS